MLKKCAPFAIEPMTPCRYFAKHWITAGWLVMLSGCDGNYDIEPPQTSRAEVETHDFPVTPATPTVLLSIDDGLQDVADDELVSRFERTDGAEWNGVLSEMKRRQTPKLMAAMVANLDEVKGIVALSGEAIYAPELRFPVATALMDCGEKPVADLIRLSTAPHASIRKKLLAARVLRHLQASGCQAASRENMHAAMDSPADWTTFNELWAISGDHTQMSAILGD